MEQRAAFFGTEGEHDLSQPHPAVPAPKNRISRANGEEKNLFSDTPQGGLYGIDNQTYLTDARKINTTNSGNESASSNSTDKSGSTYKDSEQSSGNVDTTEDYIETIVGKQNSENYSSLIMKYRETFLNIDMQVIKEFDELFFGLW